MIRRNNHWTPELCASLVRHLGALNLYPVRPVFPSNSDQLHILAALDFKWSRRNRPTVHPTEGRTYVLTFRLAIGSSMGEVVERELKRWSIPSTHETLNRAV